MTTYTAVDLFAGLGGSSQGAVETGKIHVAWAANHNPRTVALHMKNHPETHHACQDLNQVDPRTIPPHHIMLASPCCQGHSNARGAEKPHHDALRNTAWAVTAVAEYHMPETLVVENVKEFLLWGPNQNGEMFALWLKSLEVLGYKTTVNLLDAADFGVPQHRERVFIVANRRQAIDIVNPNKPHVSARNIIDWDGGKWNPIDPLARIRAGLRPLADATMGRIRKGLAKHGNEFLVPYYSSAVGGRSVDRPVGTVSTKPHFGVVRNGSEIRMFSIEESRRAMSFPDTYLLPEDRDDAYMMLGNAVPPGMMKGILEQVIPVMEGKRHVA